MDITADHMTDVVVESFALAPDRLREVMTLVVRHLHFVVTESRLTPEEWRETVRFLTAVGQKCDDTRQEFAIL